MKKIKNILLLLSIFAFTFISANLTIAYLITETSPQIGTFIPNKNPTKDLVISAPVEHDLGTSYSIPDNIAFEYEINLGQIYSGKTITTSEGDVVADSNGIFKVKVQANGNIVISNIDETIDITVKYLDTTPGFVVEEKEQIIKLSETSEVSFENIYEPEKVELNNFTVSGEKVLETREWVDGDTFAFKLEVNVNGTWIELGTDTITYDSTDPNSKKFDLSSYLNGQVLPNVGEYNFRLTEVIDETKEITDYDNSIKKFSIIVTDDDMDGKLEIADLTTNQYIEFTKEDDSYKLNVLFNTSYSTYELIYEDDEADSFVSDEDIVVVRNHTYDINTVIENFDGLSDDYTYKLYDKDGNELNSSRVRTGDYVIINSNNQEYKFYMVFKGDVNGDGDIAPIDYVKIKNHIMGEKIIDGKVYELAADFNDDDGITPLDYVKVKNHIMNGGN